MADGGSKKGAKWPLPKFFFEADFGTGLTGIRFQEFLGVDQEVRAIEYRAGTDPATIETPGLHKSGTVALKRGIFVNDDTFWRWVDEIQMNTLKRRTIIVRLLNEEGIVFMEWSLLNAWPTKISTTDLKSHGKEVAVDTLEVAYESLTVPNKG